MPQILTAFKRQSQGLLEALAVCPPLLQTSKILVALQGHHWVPNYHPGMLLRQGNSPPAATKPETCTNFGTQETLEAGGGLHRAPSSIRTSPMRKPPNTPQVLLKPAEDRTAPARNTCSLLGEVGGGFPFLILASFLKLSFAKT